MMTPNGLAVALLGLVIKKRRRRPTEMAREHGLLSANRQHSGPDRAKGTKNVFDRRHTSTLPRANDKLESPSSKGWLTSMLAA